MTYQIIKNHFIGGGESYSAQVQIVNRNGNLVEVHYEDIGHGFKSAEAAEDEIIRRYKELKKIHTGASSYTVVKIFEI